jgi:hypothetical protein
MMHIAVLIALIGLVIPAYRLLANLNDLSLTAAVVSQLAMAIVCLIFVIASVQSFVSARRNRITDDAVV